MEINLIVSWCVSILLLIISIFLVMGKGNFLIAGYNTSSMEEKKKYDKLKLCRVVGLGALGISTIFMILSYYKFEMPSYLTWLIPWGVLGIALVVLVLSNTYCKKIIEYNPSLVKY